MIITISDLAQISEHAIKAWHEIPQNPRLAGSRILTEEEQRAASFLQAALVLLNSRGMLKPAYSNDPLIRYDSDDFSGLPDE